MLWGCRITDMHIVQGSTAVAYVKSIPHRYKYNDRTLRQDHEACPERSVKTSCYDQIWWDDRMEQQMHWGVLNSYIGRGMVKG